MPHKPPKKSSVFVFLRYLWRYVSGIMYICSVNLAKHGFRFIEMEELMYFVWQQRLVHSLVTPDGQSFTIIHPGLRNLDAGPDFFNAKIKIDGITWAGNVEMHCRASDWYRHHHDDDYAYNNVILHVVLEADVKVTLPNGKPILTIVMEIPPSLLNRYHQLINPDHTTLLPGQTPSYSSISCACRLGEVPKIVINDWKTALCTQRMLQKTQRVHDLVDGQLKSWNEAIYVVLTRSLGTNANSDAMERLARSLPYSHLLHHGDNLLQLKALLLGQAGFLQSIDATRRPEAEQQEWLLMQREYSFLRQKFSLTPLPVTVWETGRIRPAAHPLVRLKALASLLYRQPDLFSRLLEAKDITEMERFLHRPGIGLQTARCLIINAIVPTMITYAQWQGDDERCERALSLLEHIPAESNRCISLWLASGLSAHSAFDSQALLQLFTQYCQPHKCLRCRIGCWLLAHDPKGLQTEHEIPF